MSKKKTLQAQADELGVDYVQSDTIAQLEAKIEAHLEEANEPRLGEDFTDADKLCPQCRKPADHVHAGSSRQQGV